MKFVFAVIILLAAIRAEAAMLTGRVVDSTEAVLPGVIVEAAARDGRTFAATSRADGSYAISVDGGTYDVSFRLLNFATTTKRNVVVTDAATVDATLYLSASADVVVTAPRTFRNLRDIDTPEDDLAGIADAATVGVVTAEQIARRPFQRAGEILETVPGVIVSQHSGEGKANQYYLRGFNLDHGTDLAITVAGVPVNMPTHAHGQGYADANFLIPELISGVQYKKGPYFADEGDFAGAGAVNVNYLNLLSAPIALAQGGSFGYGRALVAASPRIGNGFLLFALETTHNDGPWVQPDDYRRVNAVLRYTTGGQHGGASITAMAYDARWRATDQIPQRAVRDGSLPRFGFIDGSDGGSTSRHSLSADWQRNSATRLTQLSAYALQYRLDLFSNFTYFLDDPVYGDQFEQKDDRLVYGFDGAHRWLSGRFENVVGIEGRHDSIDDVGLHRTIARKRHATIRVDDIEQSSIAGHLQTSMQWSSRLRTVGGLRYDHYELPARDASLLSPKLSVIGRPFDRLEVYANAGSGFHSNDARGGTDVTPLVRTKGAELGLRTILLPRLHLTAGLWGLDIDSELVFVGDAGTTEAGRASRRRGVEIAASYDLREWLAIDAQYARSHARFRDDDPAGNRIPGAVEGVASVGVSVPKLRRFSGELRYRYFGPRPLIEDDSVRSDASHLVSARLGYELSPRFRLDVDVFNLLDSDASDVDYFYASRLRHENTAVEDVHFHPVESRSVRVGIATTF